MRRSHARWRALLIGAAALVSISAGAARAAQILSTWDGDGGSALWSNPANWNPDGVPNNGANTHDVRIDDGDPADITVVLNQNAVIDRLTLSAGDRLQINNGQSLTVVGGAGAGSILNAGELTLNSSASLTNLRISGGTVTLSGGGTVTLGNHVNNRIVGSAATDRLINVDNLIHGGGQFGADLLAITNHGTIIADQPAALTIDPSNSGVINTGEIRAAPGRTLQLAAGTYANSDAGDDGLIRADGGTISMTSATITGGAVDVLGAGLITLNGATFNSVAVANSGSGIIRAASGINTITGQLNNPAGGQIEIGNTAGLSLVAPGSCVNAGTLRLNAAASTATLRINGVIMLTGGGTVVLSNSNNNRILGATGTDRLINVDNTIEGAGQVGFDFLGMTNYGTIRANQAVPITIDPNLTSDVVNEGVIHVAGAGGLHITDGPFINRGLVQIDGSRTLNRTGDYSQTGGQTLVNGALQCSGTIRVNGGQIGGTGQILGSVVNAATLAPGDPLGTQTITGNWAQTNAGRLEIEIGGTAPGQYDRLAVNGAATLDGKLDIRFVAPYVPIPGDTYVILTYGSAAGTFPQIEIECPSNGALTAISYGATALTLQIVAPVRGDLNCDCLLESSDVSALVMALIDPAGYAAAFSGCDIRHGDLNEDGMINGADVAPFLDLMLP